MEFDSKGIPESGFLTPVWVKRRYVISNATMYEWISKKHLPAPLKIGPRAVRFRAEDIRGFEEKLRVSQGKTPASRGSDSGQPHGD